MQQLKQEPGRGLYVGGVTLPLALADMGRIDEYEFVVHPILAGHGSRVPDLQAARLAASAARQCSKSVVSAPAATVR